LFEWKGPVADIGPHADFFNAWEPERLQELVDVCVRGRRTTNLDIKVCKLPGT
jgi:hypothetical protein